MVGIRTILLHPDLVQVKSDHLPSHRRIPLTQRIQTRIRRIVPNVADIELQADPRRTGNRAHRFDPLPALLRRVSEAAVAALVIARAHVQILHSDHDSGVRDRLQQRAHLFEHQLPHLRRPAAHAQFHPGRVNRHRVTVQFHRQPGGTGDLDIPFENAVPPA